MGVDLLKELERALADAAILQEQTDRRRCTALRQVRALRAADVSWRAIAIASLRASCQPIRSPWVQLEVQRLRKVLERTACPAEESLPLSPDLIYRHTLEAEVPMSQHERLIRRTTHVEETYIQTPTDATALAVADAAATATMSATAPQVDEPARPAVEMQGVEYDGDDGELADVTAGGPCRCP